MRRKKKDNHQPGKELEVQRRRAPGMEPEETESHHPPEEIDTTLNDEQSILNSISELVVCQDAGMIVRWANKAACESVASDPGQLLGRHCYEIWHQRSEPCEGCPIVKVFATGEEQESEISSPDGREWHIKGYPISVDDKVTSVVEITTDITKRKGLEETLKENEEKLSGILAAVADHMSMIDEEHDIVWANDTAKRLFGEDVVGKKCFAAYHGFDKPCEPCITAMTFADGKIHEHETEVIGIDGRKIAFWCIASVAARKEDGSPKLVVEVSRDISDRKKVEEELRRRSEELEAFAHTISHDLRNPLSLIEGYALSAEEAHAGGRGEMEVESLRSIVKATRRMDRFIEALLQYAIAGKLEGEAVRVEPDKILREVIEEHAEIFLPRKAEMILHEGIPAVLVDPFRLKQVLSNIVSNALKFQGDNPLPRVEIGGKRKVGSVTIYVRDNGVGIPYHQQESIFEPFKRLGVEDPPAPSPPPPPAWVSAFPP